MTEAVPELSTARFTLRPIRRADAAALFPTLNDEAQSLYMTRPAFSSEEELADWLFDPEWNGRTWIAETPQREVAGRFVAMPAHEDGVVEIGYITCIRHQRNGVALECVAALVTHLFEVEGARKLIAEVDSENVASIRLLERLGFTREALFREHETTHKGLCDVAIYGLLRREFAGLG